MDLLPVRAGNGQHTPKGIRPGRFYFPMDKNPCVCESLLPVTADAKLAPKVTQRLNTDASIAFTVFWNRCETIPAAYGEVRKT
jgi:hypothetical protein